MTARALVLALAAACLALPAYGAGPKIAEVRVGYDAGYSSSDVGYRLKRATGTAYDLATDFHVANYDKGTTDSGQIFGLSFGFGVGDVTQKEFKGDISFSHIEVGAVGGGFRKTPVGLLIGRLGYLWTMEFAAVQGKDDAMGLMNLSHHGLQLHARLDQRLLAEELQFSALLSSGYHAMVGVRLKLGPDSPVMIGLQGTRTSRRLRQDHEPDRDRDVNRAILYLAWAFGASD